MARTSPDMRYQCCSLLALVLLSSASSSNAATLAEQVRACATIATADQRLECYDRLGRQVVESADTVAPVTAQDAPAAPPAASGEKEAPAAPAAATAGASAGASPKKPPDENFGGYQFKDPEEDPDEMAMVTRVVDCQKERGSGSWYFRFENDQVWKQVDRHPLNFQDCDFPVKVVSDGFGYVMRIEGRELKIRISRRK